MNKRINEEFISRARLKMIEFIAPSNSSNTHDDSISDHSWKFADSIKIQAYHKGKKVIDHNWGRDFEYYDLASLTKIIFTACSLMDLVDLKKLDLNKSVSSYLSWWPYEFMKVREVQSHIAGLNWWAPFYTKIKKGQKFLSRMEIKNLLMAIPLITTVKPNGKKTKSHKSLYSDLDLILLSFLLEEIRGSDLLSIFEKSKISRHIPGLHFNSGNIPKFKRSLYAPTEKCPWRKKVLQGEVHDDNTWSFGGVSTHAGLFGRIEDVSKFGLILRDNYRNKKSNKIAKNNTVRKFVKRAMPKSQGDWALGFMLPSKGSSSSGKYFSPRSFGHTGFTGTSIWYDPMQDLLVVILSNRVYPSRKNINFLKLRPLLHDCVVEAIRNSFQTKINQLKISKKRKEKV